MRATQQEQYIEFGIADQQYAISIKDIHEIIKMQELTKLLVGIGVSDNGLLGILKLDEVLLEG